MKHFETLWYSRLRLLHRTALHQYWHAAVDLHVGAVRAMAIVLVCHPCFYYPGQKKKPSSRFAAIRTLFHVWYHARSGAISAGQKSQIGLALRWSRLIEHDITRGTAFFSPRISMMVLIFLSRVVDLVMTGTVTMHDDQGPVEKEGRDGGSLRLPCLTVRTLNDRFFASLASTACFGGAL